MPRIKVITKKENISRFWKFSKELLDEFKEDFGGFFHTDNTNISGLELLDGDLIVTEGNLDVNNDITLGGDLTATAGDVTVTAGDVTVTAGDVIVTAGDVSVGGSLTSDSVYTGDLSAIGTISGTVKTFNIPHPSDNSKRLVHACLEGPEAAVYFRGKETSNSIELPEYWKDLVDTNSITVHLTPTSLDQNLICLGVINNKVLVNNSHNQLFHYIIYGERKDIQRLEVEINA